MSKDKRQQILDQFEKNKERQFKTVKRNKVWTETVLTGAKFFKEAKLRRTEKLEFSEISREFDEERRKTEKLYRDEYDTRIDVAKKQIRDKLFKSTPELKPPGMPSDRLNRQRVERMAMRQVYFKHQQTMHRIDKAEAEKKDEFLSLSSAAKEWRNDFKSASQQVRKEDRRQSPDRRSVRIQTTSE